MVFFTDSLDAYFFFFWENNWFVYSLLMLMLSRVLRRVRAWMIGSSLLVSYNDIAFRLVVANVVP